MATGKTEEYLETILSLISKNSSPAKNKDIAKELDIAPATVTEMIQRLSDDGFVKYIPYKGVELTAEGVKKATELQHSHNIIRDFLSQVLRIDDVGCRQGKLVCLNILLQILCLKVCWHIWKRRELFARHIADISDTCRSTDGDYVRLNDLHEGEMATVALIHLPKSDRDRLTSLGMVTGEDIEIKRRQKQGCLSILAKGTEIALGKEIANKVFVIVKGASTILEVKPIKSCCLPSSSKPHRSQFQEYRFCRKSQCREKCFFLKSYRDRSNGFQLSGHYCGNYAGSLSG